MINKRLIGIVPESKCYIALQVLFLWFSLIANITMMTAIAGLLAQLIQQQKDGNLLHTACIAAVCLIVRYVCTQLSSKMSYLSAKSVKLTLREKIYSKLLGLGTSYREQIDTAEVVQVAVEGVEQLDTYFGAYLPQFFYAMLAPLTLFGYLCFYNVPAAMVLLICVPFIPVSIALVQKWAKKLLSKYWGQYTKLGGTFLENLQGLTTLKIYQADEFKNQEMNGEAEKFRTITMKVLSMQLNSITIMDFIAYGGAALGVILAAMQYRAGNASLMGSLLIILLSADFFIPMRQLGSFFHVAMNGMAASDKIFRLLDLPEQEARMTDFPATGNIAQKDIHFAYDKSREILHGIDLDVKRGSLTSIVGESGCGKSTIAAILMGRNRGYAGKICIGETELQDISESSLMRNITYVSYQSYLFKGTVRENLHMGNSVAGDEALWKILERVKLADFLRTENGLDTSLNEGASNLSGGQRQRLALARALFHDSPVYIFDEATSNIDVESENDIMEQILALAKEKTVLLISHRLANVVQSNRIYVMDHGSIVETGTHEVLLRKQGKYHDLWFAQQKLENFGKEGLE